MTLKRLRELEKMATAGPWREEFKEDPRFEEEQLVVAPADAYDAEHGRKETIVIGTGYHDGLHIMLREDDTNLIVAARNALPALLHAIAAADALATEVGSSALQCYDNEDGDCDCYEHRVDRRLDFYRAARKRLEGE